MSNRSPPGVPLDPQLAALLETGRLDLPAWHTMSVAEARRVEDETFSAGEGPEMAAVTDRTIAGPGGDLPVRLYQPRAGDRPATPANAGTDAATACGAGGNDAAPPALVFYHGGGWVMGTLDSADDVCRHLAAGTGAVVVSVDYRLAPEHPYPAALEDAWAALAWVREAADSLGVDPDRVGVAGTSSGAGLAAAVGLRARDAGVPVAVQVLCYPVLDPAGGSAPTSEADEDAGASGETAAAAGADGDASQSGDTATGVAATEDAGDEPLLSRADVRWFWDQYLRSPADARDPLAAPARAASLAGCPPTVIATAGHDVLHAEGAAFAERLAASDVATTHLHYPALCHGFLSLAGDIDSAAAATSEVLDAVGEQLETGPAAGQ